MVRVRGARVVAAVVVSVARAHGTSLFRVRARVYVYVCIREPSGTHARTT